MFRLLKYVVILFLVIAVVVVALPFVIPASVLKAQVETLASDVLDRDLTIEGDLEVSFWPPLSVTATNVRLANADGLAPDSMVQLAGLDLAVDAFAYLGGLIKVDRLVLSGPQIDLHIDENGKGNWPGGGTSGDSRTEASPQTESAPLELPQFSLGEIRIEDGRISLVDRANALERNFEDINLSLTQDGTDGRIKIDGQVVQGGEQAELAGEIANPLALAQGDRSDLALTLALPGGGVEVSGALDGGAQAFDLALSVDLNDPRHLADWLGQPIVAPADTLNGVRLETALAGDPSQIRLDEFALAVDDIEAQGNLAVDLGERPRVSGALELGELVLDRYLGEPGEAAEPATEGAVDEAGSSDGGWPDDPIELPLPLPLDIDLVVTLDALQARGWEVGKTSLEIDADTQSNRISITEMALYEGATTATFELAPGEPHEVEAEFNARGIEIHPILLALAELDLLEGKGNVEMTIESRGASVKALVESLNGEGALLLRDGAVIGINIGAVMRSVMTLGASADARQVQRTDFAELGGTFTIENGIVRNEDLAMRAPTLRVSGAGTVDLPAQSVNYRLRPAIAGTLQGQDATDDEAFKTGIPIVVNGPWADPEIQIELDGTLTGDLRDPAALAETIAGLTGDSDRLESLKEKLGITDAIPADAVEGLVGGDDEAADAIKDALGAVLGGGPAEEASGDTTDRSGDEPSNMARDALKNLLGR